MRNRNNVVTMILLSGTLVLYATCAEVAGQSSQRGYSSRGMNRVGAQRSAPQARVTRPTNNQSTYRNRANVTPEGR
jgi:hypothetical protein